MLRNRKLLALCAPLLTCGLLVGVRAERAHYADVDDAGPYHQKLLKAMESLPQTIGEWVGSDIEVPKAAISLLGPNAISSRRYINFRTGQQVNMLIVQCRDIRDIAGHYPPICYRYHGWELYESKPAQRQVGTMTIPITQYELSRTANGTPAHVIVENFMVLPDRSIVRDMDAVRAATGDYRRRRYGAAQFQVVFDASIPEDQRRGFFTALVGGHKPLIEMIKNVPRG